MPDLFDPHSPDPIFGPAGRKARTIQKHQKVKDRFWKLYDIDRIRMDDAIKKVAEEFFYSVRTVEDIVFKK